MNRKVFFKISLTLSLVAFVGVQSTYGIDKDTQEKLRLKAINTMKYTLPADGGARGRGLTSGVDRTAGQNIGSTYGSSSLGCTPGAVDPVRGLTFGCTFYDYQRNGSMDRIIATDAVTHNLNFTWMNQDNNSATGGRNVKYEGYNVITDALGDGTGGVDIGGDLIPPNRSGYTAIDSRNGGAGLVVNAHHWNKDFGNGGRFFTYVWYNATSTFADFVGNIVDSTITDPELIPGATQVLWPRVAYTNDGAGTEVTHVVMHTDAGGDDAAMYIRKVGAGNTGSWTNPLVFASGGYQLSSSITASRKAGSQKVVIAGDYGRGDGTALGGSFPHSNGLLSGQQDNDLFYMESTDAGATWGPLTNVTKRPDSLAHPNDPVWKFAPGAKLDVLYDQNDVFHIVWQAGVWNGYGGPFTFQGRLFHYDPVSDKIRIVHDFVWDQTMCNGGAFNLNATNPQISECDNKLYVTFEQFNDIPAGLEDDCSEAASTAPSGAANADIYVTVSDNGGLNWDLKRNLTATYTPNCDTIPGGANPDCDSDAWHSTTRYGVDVSFDLVSNIADLSSNIGGYAGNFYLYVQYVNDADPGGAIQAEGSWTNNSLKVFRFGCVEKVSNPVLASSIPVGQAVEDPAFTPPGTDSTLPWLLTNVGNAPATYTIALSNQSPPGNVAITGGALSGTISEGDPNFTSLNIVLNAGLATTVQHAHADIQVTGNFVGSPLDLAIDYTIGDLELRKVDTLDDCVVFANTGGIGLQNNNGLGGLTMDFQNEPASLECDTTGNADNYLFDGSPIISYNGGQVVSSMFSSSIVDTFQFRPLTAPSHDNASDPDWFLGNSGQFTTQDSTLCFNIDWFAPKTTIFNNPNWKIVYGRVCYYNNSASPIDSVFTAFGWDWDVPSDTGSRNTSNIDASNFLLSLQGLETGQDTGNTACQPNDERWAASIYVPTSVNGLPDYTDGGSGAMGSGFFGMYTRDNATYVGGDWDHPKLDTALHTISGFSKFSSPDPDSLAVDLHMVLNGGAYRIDPDDSVYLWFIMVTGIGTQTDFDNCVAAAKGIAPPVTPAWTLGCCVTPGDYNNDGSFNIADVTAGIGRIFSGAAAPSCQDQADSNGDNTFNIADVTYGIARIFSGGAAPVCGTTGS